eukprot:2798408-Ditylum_brightwellii.AAC.1
MIPVIGKEVVKELAQQSNKINTAIIFTATATAVSTITDDLRNNKKDTTVKEVHTVNGSTAHGATSTTTATIESNLLNTSE